MVLREVEREGAHLRCAVVFDRCRLVLVESSRVDLVHGKGRTRDAFGALTLAAAARFRSRMALAVDNTPTNSDVEVEGLFQDDYWLYDASLTWQATDVLSVALQGRNLSDEVYKTDGQEFSSVDNIRTVYYGAPRTWSVVFRAAY